MRIQHDRHRTEEPPARASRRRTGSVRTAAVALAILAGVAAIPASALAANWGPVSSYYSGIKRVTGNGTFTRLSTGSRSYVKACDQYNEGWGVYGYSRWTDLSNANFTEYHATGVTGGCTSATWTLGWWNPSGFWVTAASCAEAGWPVPNSCTSPFSEAHRP